MENEQLIPVDDFCTHYHVEQTFIMSLHEAGLIEITTMEEKVFLQPSQLHELERFCRLHYELDINTEGVEAIAHLLQRIKELQDELQQLKRRLHLTTENEHTDTSTSIIGGGTPG